MLEDISGDARGVYGLQRCLGLEILPPLGESAARLHQIFLVDISPLLDKVANHIQPLVIPRQDPGPNFIRLVRLDLLAIYALHAAEYGDALVRAWEGVEEPAEKDEREMTAGHVEVAEVGGVGLVDVVVAFEERGSRGRYGGEEETAWAEMFVCRVGEAAD